jgi:hypothetical protein
MDFMREGGYFMWLIALTGVVVLGFSARAFVDVRSTRPAAIAMTHVDAVLFWGAFAVAAGLLSTAVGLYQMAEAFERAGAVSTSLAWGGFRVALLPTQAGLLVFTLALLLWFFLWYALRRRMPLASTP